jgi:hypothetical protein
MIPYALHHNHSGAYAELSVDGISKPFSSNPSGTTSGHARDYRGDLSVRYMASRVGIAEAKGGGIATTRKAGRGRIEDAGTYITKGGIDTTTRKVSHVASSARGDLNL